MQELVRLRMRPSRDKRSFRYMLDYVDEQGNRRQVSLGHADKRKAERQRREKELELRSGIVGLLPMKLSDFFEDSLRRTKGQVRSGTLRETERVMRHFIGCVGDIDVQDVRYEHGERLVRHRLDQGLSPATVAKEVRHLKRVFQLGEDRGQLDRHPLRRLKQPKCPRRKVHVYSEEECSGLLRAAWQYEEQGSPVMWKLLVQMCLCTGMRRGELLNTTWRDVDFANKAVDVSPKKDRKDAWEWHIKDTDRRRLPLTDDVLALLAEHEAAQPVGYPYLFVPSERYDRIQARRKTGKWTVEDGRCPLDNFDDHFKRIRKLASIEQGTFHDLRRTCLSDWIAQGLSLYEVKELAGHAKIETTERFYLAVRQDVLDRARLASEASRKGDFVAHLLRAPSEDGKERRLPNTSA